MSERRYMLITVDDARRLAQATEVASDTAGGDVALDKLRDRLARDTGADVEDIVDKLKGLPLCAACKVEGQERFCNTLDARRWGRRLGRLVKRALGLIEPGEAEVAP